MTEGIAQGPPLSPPSFPPPKVLDGQRTAEHVEVPDSTNNSSGPLEMSWRTAAADEDMEASWKEASAGALVENNPSKLRRASSIAGNVLVAETEEGKKAFWMQRKLTEETHSRNYVRVGFPLKPALIEDEEMLGAWTVKRTEGGQYPFEMAAIKVQPHAKVFPDDDDEDEEGANGDEKQKEVSKISLMRNPKNEISALQMIKAADPDGTGHVLGAEYVVTDDVMVYIIMPYCKEGSLLDKMGASGRNGRLEEAEACKFFCDIVKGLATLQKVGLCHRNLSLERMLIRGEHCHISSLGWCVRIPTSEDGSVRHLIEPSWGCGKQPEYVAPELFLNQPFDGFAVDIWAAGVMLYLLLFGGDMLFAAPIPEDPKFQEMCVRGNLKSVVDKFQALIPSEKPVSEEAIDLVQNMLLADPAKRLTLSQIQDHPWVKGGA
ncbi:activated protein kinase catalytic subunit alpha-1 [Seminavis robusta]|uniref:Activated protein kinase catalytic subunit alpha-1 n=1 Tax=Seminavis robusta TaxID=568900 RepID=A0A9N8HM71_9STRA|nr:activated protein kinase catalytic subunit alpha-1 [Seminavis robusta]|eukprot:Sro1090_g240170.1 activated protein kinase catalytic subunit alpha-1 (433) ;mRNA; f:20924-22486